MDPLITHAHKHINVQNITDKLSCKKADEVLNKFFLLAIGTRQCVRRTG